MLADKSPQKSLLCKYIKRINLRFKYLLQNRVQCCDILVLLHSFTTYFSEVLLLGKLLNIKYLKTIFQF